MGNMTSKSKVNLKSAPRNYVSSSSDSDEEMNSVVGKYPKKKEILSSSSDSEIEIDAGKTPRTQMNFSSPWTKVVSTLSPSIKRKTHGINENIVEQSKNEGHSKGTHCSDSDGSDSEVDVGLTKNTAKDLAEKTVNTCKGSTRKRKAQNDDSDVKPPKIASTSKSVPKLQSAFFTEKCNLKNTCSPRSKRNEVNHCIPENKKITELSNSKNKSARKNLFSQSSPRLHIERCQSKIKCSRSKNDSDQKNSQEKSKILTPLSICENLEMDSSDEEIFICRNKIPETDIESNKSLNDLMISNESSPSKLLVKSNSFSPTYKKTTNSVYKLSSQKSNDTPLKRFECTNETSQRETRSSPLKIGSTTSSFNIKSANEQSPKKMERDPECSLSSQKGTRSIQKSKLNETVGIDNDGQISPGSITETPVREEKHPRNNQEEKKENKKDSHNDYSTPTKRGKKMLATEKRTPLSSIKNNKTSSPNTSSCLKKIATGTTPTSKKTTRGFLTPSMAKKERETCDIVEDVLDQTRKQLHISTIPKSLPCRGGEFSQIESFLTKKIEHASGGCMYISGVPGTGKTATVHAVIRRLQHRVDEDEIPDFDFVEVNGLRLTEPKQAYVKIYQALTDRKLTADQAQQHLNRRFSGACKKPTIILVDELDYLCNRRQDVVYNILDWPSKRSSRLAVLTISNTMDLPERTLKGRVTSRMGLTRLVFQPYSYHQLREIVQDRLCGTSIFHPDAVQLVVRKVAAVSGDARRALDICRRTMEQVGPGEQVSVVHVEKALTQIFSGPRVQVIQGLSGLSQLVLRAVRDVNHRTGVDEATVRQVYHHLQQICILEGFLLPSVGAVLQTIVSLVSSGLVIAEKGRLDIARKLSLNVSSDDIHYALDKVKSL